MTLSNYGEEFLKELTTLQEADEPAVDDTPATEDVPEPEQESPSPAPDTSIDEPEAREPWEERIDAIKNHFETTAQYFARELQSIRETARYQPQQPQEQVQPERIEYQPSHEGMHLQQQINYFGEKERYSDAVESLRARYGEEFDRLITPDNRRKALNTVLQQGAFGQHWEQAMHLKFLELRDAETQAKLAEAKKQQDQVAKKREQKAQESLKAASAVAPGGAQFQKAPETQLNPLERGFKSARAGFLSDLKAAR